MSDAVRTITAMTYLADADETDTTTPVTVELQPDASILAAIGRGHDLASAIADLVDNSIDAGATRIGIQFVTKDARVRSVRIRDDGCGMTGDQLQHAMVLGGSEKQGSGKLGHFGVGLKAASMSQATMLAVFSTTGFAPAAGMRLHREQSGPQIQAEVIPASAAANVLRLRGFDTDAGTLIEWYELESVSVATGWHARRKWLETMINSLRDSLGMTFHRLLADDGLRIEIQEVDEATTESGPPRVVKPVDPFAFEQWGAAGYPRALMLPLSTGGMLAARFFVLPPGVEAPNARLLGRPRADWQGLYVYRNNRLLQAGGWLSLTQASDALQLGRVILEFDDDVHGAIAMNAEKRGVVLRPPAVQALERTHEGGFTLNGYFAEVRAVWTNAQKHELKAQPVARPGDGAPAGLLPLVTSTIGVRDEDPALSFVIEAVPPGALYSFEPGTGVVRISPSLAGRSDFELLKTSLFLLLEPHVGKQWLAEHTRQKLDVVHAAFAAVVSASVVEPNSAPAADEGENEPEEIARDLSEDAEPNAPPDLVDDPVGEEPPALVRTTIIHTADKDEPLGDPAVANVHVDEDPVKDYMARAGRAPLLSADEEVEVARRIEVGVLAAERLRTLVPTDHPRSYPRELRMLVRDGELAMRTMIEANLRLVISIARKHLGSGMDMLDLIQEGNIGLHRAVQKFDHRLGNKFSTYSTWWIRQSMNRAMADQGRLIRFPVHVIEKLPKIAKAWEESTGTMERRLATVAAQVEEAPKALRSIIDNMYPPLSLDYPWAIDAGDETVKWGTLADQLVDTEAYGPDDVATTRELPRRIATVLGGLPEQHSEIVRRRFGLDGKDAQTLDTIGDHFGVTRERIRQIEKKALTRLQEIAPAFDLREYLQPS